MPYYRPRERHFSRSIQEVWPVKKSYMFAAISEKILHGLLYLSAHRCGAL